MLKIRKKQEDQYNKPVKGSKQKFFMETIGK
jgi:hypothetical protein